ncbi:hypothetical protein ACTMU2_37955 [Cupriavidus basilensis]
MASRAQNARDRVELLLLGVNMDTLSETGLGQGSESDGAERGDLEERMMAAASHGAWVARNAQQAMAQSLEAAAEDPRAAMSCTTPRPSAMSTANCMRAHGR